MKQSEEATVVLGAVPEDRAKQLLSSASGQTYSGLANGVPVFEQQSYYSFRVEWAEIGDDLQFHFFLPKQAKLDDPAARTAWMRYWVERFPLQLDPVAREYFDADVPRLIAKYTEEETSWWLKAQGYTHLVDRKAFVTGFFQKLDEALKLKDGASN